MDKGGRTNVREWLVGICESVEGGIHCENI